MKVISGMLLEESAGNINTVVYFGDAVFEGDAAVNIILGVPLLMWKNLLRVCIWSALVLP